ncbi:uncharacterized protein [Triticum aestivum]|uniref:uncharacterized protein n=1 Tax=Triticum aestivum TaxID=4565 RepID=UPI001D0280FB|nr:uncharacterized protein LOC123153309 [Triticum aestivum]
MTLELSLPAMEALLHLQGLHAATPDPSSCVRWIPPPPFYTEQTHRPRPLEPPPGATGSGRGSPGASPAAGARPRRRSRPAAPFAAPHPRRREARRSRRQGRGRVRANHRRTRPRLSLRRGGAEPSAASSLPVRDRHRSPPCRHRPSCYQLRPPPYLRGNVLLHPSAQTTYRVKE